MQLIPETAQRYGVKNVFDPEENIRGGVHYLSDLLDMFGHDLERALAAYNAGEGAVTRYGGIPPYQETSTYVNRALTVYYGRPYEPRRAQRAQRGIRTHRRREAARRLRRDAAADRDPRSPHPRRARGRWVMGDP